MEEITSDVIKVRPLKIKPKKFLTGTVGNLVTGLKYEFRVVAVNRGSRSKPSEATAPQLGRLCLVLFLHIAGTPLRKIPWMVSV